MTRREILAAIGLAAGSAFFWACGSAEENPVDDTGPCPPTPEQEGGPFYVDDAAVRSDLLDGQSGVPLELWIKVLTARTCTPVLNAAVEIWSANAAGKFSDNKRSGTGGEQFLRGTQMTDAEGFVKFRTIYPGWYSGSASHVHVKVRLQADGQSAGRLVQTGQLFFPADVNEALRPVYPDNKNEFVNNDKDRVFRKQGGKRSMITLEGSLDKGFAGTAIIDISV